MTKMVTKLLIIRLSWSDEKRIFPQEAAYDW
jgi:hypothetical protein